MGKNNLFALKALGQSPWYDNIDRRLILDGDLARLFEQGITGVTSNPSIFEKAINASSIYDGTIGQLAEAGKAPQEIYDVITVQDVQSAADLLLETYKRSEGIDGYVSLEVLPEYANDAARTIDHARKIQKEVGRPNLMIKVPGTREGSEAIRVLTSEGINVNVTLLFSLRHYEQSAKAYINGLKDRVKEGRPVERVCSVASVFISRVDASVDKLLEGLDEPSLKGKTATANAKMIYQRFKEIFYGEDFSEVAAKGARVQRVLWGSTGTKDPDYSDVKYVDGLIGKDTINTLPHNTMVAFMDHGNPKLTIEDNLDTERKHLETLATQGIDLERVCDEVQQQGVEAFGTSFQQLIRAIVQKAGPDTPQ